MANALNIDLEGKTVLVAAEFMKGDTSEKARTFRCEGGYGCRPYTHGTAIVGEWADGSGRDRIEGFMVEKLLPVQED